MQIAIVLYPGMTTLDAIGPYEVLRQSQREARIPFMVGRQPSTQGYPRTEDPASEFYPEVGV